MATGDETDLKTNLASEAGTGTLVLASAIQAGKGIAEFGNAVPGSKPVITGTMTAATLSQLTAVVLQILVALDNKGTVSNTTT